MTQVPQCNPNLSPPAANFLRLCDSQKCFDYYREFVDVCTKAGVNLITYLPAAASQDMFCPGYVTGDCKEVPGALLSTAYRVALCATYVCVTIKVKCGHPDGTALIHAYMLSSMYPYTLCHKCPVSHSPPSLPTPLLSLLFAPSLA